MVALLTGRNGLWTLLLSSLAFNVGFGTTFGVRTYKRYCCGGGTGGGECAFRESVLGQFARTPEQQQNMTASRDRMLQQVEELRARLTIEREKLVDLLTASRSDKDLIVAQLDKIAAVQRQIQECVVTHLLEQRELLTPDQQSDFNETIRRRVCPLGRHGPESAPGAPQRHTPCRQVTGGDG